MSDIPRATRSTSMPLLFAAVLAFFFVSGACGLLYQVVWTRQLVLLFGTTSHAVSTVLSIFFLGLGLGSVWGGRLADQTHRPLWWYGVFECIIGVWAVFFVVTVFYGEGLIAGLLREFQFSRGIGVALRAFLALALLLVPVSLMGATLPLLSRFVSREAVVRGKRIGTLYTLNTLGAVLGCFLAGFFLIQSFGYTRTTLIGAVANVLVGLCAWAVSWRREPTVPIDEARPEERPATPMSSWKYLILGAFFLSGFCSLGLEVLWTRLLSIVFLGTTYAYTTMLATLLLGIALGSAFASAIVDRLRSPAFLLGACLIVTGAGCIYMLGILGDMPARVIELQRSSGDDWNAVIRGKALLAFKALFIPTFFLGMTFPLVVKAASGYRETVGRDVGRLYCANTVGGVLGSLVGGFLIIPLLGTHNGIVALGLLLVAGGLMVLLASNAWGPVWKVAAVGATAMLLVISFVRAPEDVNQALTAGYLPDNHHILHYEEGVEGTVAVSEPEADSSGANRVLWINRVQATTSIEKGVKMNRLQGVLPLLFDRDPESVLFMCFGSGITCGTLALSDFERIDAVDISAEVLEAAPYFETDNLGVIDRPEVTFHIDDGRNFLLTAARNYDVITFEPMPLAMAGVSTFYTKEYYELCLERLAPGGLVSQWIPLHSLNPDVVRSLTYTFTSTFPHYTAWFINADLFLIGSDAPLRLDAERIKAHYANPALNKALVDVGFKDVESILACYLMDEAGLDAFAEGGTVMRDDLPWAEFVAPKLVYARTQAESIALLERHMVSPEPLFLPGTDPAFLASVDRRHRAHKHDMKALQEYYSGLSIGNKAADLFMASLEIDPNDWNAQFYLRQIGQAQGEAYLRWEEYDEGLEILGRMLQYMPDDHVLQPLYAALMAGKMAEAGGDR